MSKPRARVAFCLCWARHVARASRFVCFRRGAARARRALFVWARRARVVQHNCKQVRQSGRRQPWHVAKRSAKLHSTTVVWPAPFKNTTSEVVYLRYVKNREHPLRSNRSRFIWQRPSVNAEACGTSTNRLRSMIKTPVRTRVRLHRTG